MLNDEQACDLLEGLVAIPSVSRDERAAGEFLVQQLGQLGFEARIDGAGNAIGTLGDRGPRIALVGHMDTVPGHIPVKRSEGRLFGRGSVDAKGCLATFVVASARAAASGHLAARIEFVACVEEEVASSKGARHLVHSPAPDALVIGEPSGAHAVTTGYKGFLSARLSLRQGLAHTAGEQVPVAALACQKYVDCLLYTSPSPRDS